MFGKTLERDAETLCVSIVVHSSEGDHELKHVLLQVHWEKAGLVCFKAAVLLHIVT